MPQSLNAAVTHALEIARSGMSVTDAVDSIRVFHDLGRDATRDVCIRVEAALAQSNRTLDQLEAEAAHALLVVDRAKDGIAWARTGATLAQCVEASTGRWPELTDCDVARIRSAISHAMAREGMVQS